jgi:hypothetical protein
MAGMSACLYGLSIQTTGAYVPYIVAGIDFFTTIQWVACSLLMANHYGDKPARFATAMTVLSLSSTSGTLLAKFGGTVLLQFLPSWRAVARVGSMVTLTGCLVMRFLVSEFPTGGQSPQQLEHQQQQGSTNIWKDVVEAFRGVCGTRLFWIAGFAHAATYLARSSDRVLGAFFVDVAVLPRGFCGLLTASVTLGFMHGLRKSKCFYQLPDVTQKIRMLKGNYISAVAFTMALALVGHAPLSSFLVPSKAVLAALGVMCSGGMASSLSFAFYQLPSQIAAGYGKNRAVCTSFLDGLGFFMSAIVWKLTGKIVGTLGEQYGWAASFGMVGSLFGLGGYLMLSMYPEIAARQEQAVAPA